MTKQQKIKFTIFSFVCLNLSLGAIACNPSTSEAEASAAAPPIVSHPVEVAIVETATVEHTIRTTAELKASEEVVIAPQMSERITSFPFENGDTVEKGQIIAHLRADSLKQSLAQMDAEIESLDAQIRNQEQELARGRELFAGRVITRQNLDSLDSSVAASQAQRKSLVASRRQLAISAGHSAIRAPITGVIANKNLQVGDLANPQSPICSIMVLDPLKVHVQVGELEAPLVKTGQKARIALDAFPSRIFEGRVSRIYPYLNTLTRTKNVEISLSNIMAEDNSQPMLNPGMYGNAELVVEVRERAVVVSRQALMSIDNDPTKQRVFVVDQNGIAHERLVRIGRSQTTTQEVLDGLSVNDQVVVVGQYSLTDGQQVKINKPGVAGKGA
ncbi:MAG: efflux RND transporter periplasmic adaptor subunit [Deltaproteobacteria bacterium]|nr:efflux RND transporter periplasmic adaptor subunit [Deltaproteobacteria bacterium]